MQSEIYADMQTQKFGQHFATALLWLPSWKQEEFDLWPRSSAVFCQASIHGTVTEHFPLLHPDPSFPPIRRR